MGKRKGEGTAGPLPCRACGRATSMCWHCLCKRCGCVGLAKKGSQRRRCTDCRQGRCTPQSPHHHGQQQQQQSQEHHQVESHVAPFVRAPEACTTDRTGSASTQAAAPLLGVQGPGGPPQVPGLAYTYVLAVPGPLAVRVTVTRRDPTSGLFVMEHGDAAAREAAEVAVLSVLGSYDKLLNDFVAFPRYPRDACLDVWAVASDLCFKVSFIGGEPTGASLGAAVAACCMSALFRSLLEPGLGLTGQVTLSGELGPVKQVDEKLAAGRALGLSMFGLPEGLLESGHGIYGVKDLCSLARLVIPKLGQYVPGPGLPAWHGLEGARPDRAGVEGGGLGLWYGEAEAVFFHCRDDDGAQHLEPQRPPAETDVAAAVGGGRPRMGARIQRVEVCISKGSGQVSVVGCSEGEGRRAVLRALHVLEQLWMRIPGLRGGGIGGLDFYYVFPGRQGQSLRDGDGLDGAILTATVMAILGRGRKGGTRGMAMWVQLERSGHVFCGGDEVVEVRPGVAEAVRGLASSAEVKKLLLPSRLAAACSVENDKLVAIKDIEDLLAAVAGIKLNRVVDYPRVSIVHAQVLSAAAPAGSQPNTETTRQVLGSATINVFTPQPHTLELHLDLTGDSFTGDRSSAVVPVTEGEVHVVPGAGAAMSGVRLRVHGSEVVLHKPEEGQAESWCCLVAYVRAGLEMQDKAKRALGLGVDNLMGRLEEEERVRCGVMVSTQDYIDRQWEQLQEESRRMLEDLSQRALESLPPFFRQPLDLSFGERDDRGGGAE